MATGRYPYTGMLGILSTEDKKQVQQMVQLLLHLKKTPKPDDAADAVAAAICHASVFGPSAEEYRIQ